MPVSACHLSRTFSFKIPQHSSEIRKGVSIKYAYFEYIDFLKLLSLPSLRTPLKAFSAQSDPCRAYLTAVATFFEGKFHPHFRMTFGKQPSVQFVQTLQNCGFNTVTFGLLKAKLSTSGNSIPVSTMTAGMSG
jgi:hypothetical protein